MNNAGGCDTKIELTKEGHEKVLATNYIGHFLLTDLMSDLLVNTPCSRIINISSELYSVI